MGHSFVHRYMHFLTAAIVISAHIGPAMMLPPPILRSVCGAVADAEEIVNNKAVAAGKAAVDFAMKPIAIVGGLKAAAVGTGMKFGGGAVRFVGEKMAKDGALIESTGAGVKGAGLGVAALGVRPLAQKIVTTGNSAEGSVNGLKAAANDFTKGIGETSVQIDASIDSPIIGHHHKNLNMATGKGSPSRHQGMVQQQVEQTQQQFSDNKVSDQQTHSIAKRAQKVDTEVMKSALNLVKEAQMEDCVARAICDLNCNPQGFGQDGKQVFMSVVRLQGSNIMDANESKFYRDAAAKGRSYTGKCDKCSTDYAKCKSKSSDLIKMASHIKMD